MTRATDATAIVEDGLFTIAETAEFLRLSRASVYNLMDRGELPFVKLGASRRIPKRAVVELAARSVKGLGSNSREAGTLEAE